MYNKICLTIFLILSIFWVSCKDGATSEVEFVITNNEDCDLENLVIYLTEDSDVKTESVIIGPKSTKKVILDMTFAQARDGSYTISYDINNQSKTKEFGYYTNGNPLENLISIVFENSDLTVE